ncbi:MAG: hypothetical protein ABI629_16805 [bacterium]
MRTKELRIVSVVGQHPIRYAARVDVPAPSAVVQRIEDCLRRHLSEASVQPVRDAVLGGEVVHMPPIADAPAPVVAYKRGVLFVAGTEYVIRED